MRYAPIRIEPPKRTTKNTIKTVLRVSFSSAGGFSVILFLISGVHETLQRNQQQEFPSKRGLNEK